MEFYRIKKWKRKRLQAWKDAYGKIKGCEGITKSGRSMHKAHCRYCAKDFSIASSGAYDIERHFKTSETHKAAVKAASKNTNMEKFLVNNTFTNLEQSVTRVLSNIRMKVVVLCTQKHGKMLKIAKVVSGSTQNKRKIHIASLLYDIIPKTQRE
jgi:hypothetical protein